MDSLIQGMNADGFNGDTMGLVPKEFFDVSMGLKHPVAIEPEGGGQATATVAAAEGGGNPAEWDTMGCAHPASFPDFASPHAEPRLPGGYWKYPYVPSVDSW